MKKKFFFILKLCFYGQVEADGAQWETVISVYKFLFQILILFAPLMLLLVHRRVVFEILILFYFIYEFLLIKNP